MLASVESRPAGRTCKEQAPRASTTSSAEREAGADQGDGHARSTGGMLAMAAVFALLAIPFKSYTQPLIVMTAIPFGFVGAIIGHVIMGFELSMISVMGLIALAGVVVNDSLVLIDAANEYRRERDGAPTMRSTPLACAGSGPSC